jgi:hypothetical protein
MFSYSRRRILPLVVSLGALFAGSACEGASSTATVGTSEQRRALADTILARTARREAFSVPKQTALGFSPLADMAAWRDTLIAADDEEKLFYAILRMSNARRDRHLAVGLVPNGIRPSFTDGLDADEGVAVVAAREAPIKILADFAEPGSTWFVADLAEGIDGPAPGSRVTAVNGMPVASYAKAITPYVRASNREGSLWRVAETMTIRTAEIPASLHGPEFRVEVETDSGPAAYAFPWLAADSIVWRNLSEPTYPGFSTTLKTGTYDLLIPDDGRPVVVLIWHGFRETLVQDVDSLVALGARNGWLDHAMIVDVTRSRGGSLGPYAVQRIQPRPFKTTFGTVRISDIVPLMIAQRAGDFERGQVLDAGSSEAMDNGRWQRDWFENDLREAVARGDSITKPVPFKLAHAPKNSDGILQPAAVHFRGPLAVLSAPRRGSHVDQFVSIVRDNALGPVIGMPAGGYSNTWEWSEVLTMPGTGKPFVSFMWSIGHSIRPNGEVLEGNAAAPDVPVPLTRSEALTWYRTLYGKAIDYFGSVGHPAGRSTKG